MHEKNVTESKNKYQHEAVVLGKLHINAFEVYISFYMYSIGYIIYEVTKDLFSVM